MDPVGYRQGVKRTHLLCVAWLLVVGVAGLGSPRPRAQAADADPLVVARRVHAKRLAALGASARAAKLGPLALRLFEDAHALDPVLDDARAALGWTKSAAGGRPPPSTWVPGEGWADDGDAQLERLEKQVADVGDAYVEDLLAAVSAAKGRKEFAVADRLAWAAVAAAPDDVGPRRVLAHREEAGRFVAPEHAALTRGAAAARAGWVRAGVEAVGAGDGGKADAPVAKVAGWPTPVGAGWRMPSGDAAYAVADADGVVASARLAAHARGLVAGLLGARPSARPATLLLVPSRDLADALLAADRDVDRAQLPTARAWPVWPLGKTGYDLVVAPSPGAAVAATVDTFAQREAVGRVADREAVRWVAFGMGFLATQALLGAPAGYGATRRGVAGDTSPSIRADETGLAFVRRLVACGADRPLRELATLDARALHPRDVAKAGALLDFLFLTDAARAQAFVAAVFAGTVDRAAAVEAAAKAAGYPNADALDEAWRRFVADAYPRPASVGEGRGAWKVTKLQRVPVPAGDALFGRREHPVAGSLWLAGRPYRCRPVDDGQTVEVEALQAGGAPRIVRAPGVVPFAVAREGGGGFTEVRVELGREGASWTATAADAWGGAVDGHGLVFVDLDLDGRWGGFGRDGVALDTAFTFPLRRELVLDKKVYELRRVGPDGREVAWRARPLAAKGEALDALLRWNAWRASCGLPGLAWDDALASPPPADDATLAIEAVSFAAALAAWIADPAARARLLDPETRAVGLASAAGRVVARFAREDGPSSFVGPLRFPGAPSASLPTGPVVGATGLPLTLTFEAGTDLDALTLAVELTDAAGTAVALVRSTPTGLGATGLGATLGATVVYTPAARLAPRTTYTWSASWDRRGTHVGREGVFTTD